MNAEYNPDEPDILVLRAKGAEERRSMDRSIAAGTACPLIEEHINEMMAELRQVGFSKVRLVGSALSVVCPLPRNHG